MTDRSLRVLSLQPWYGGSHRQFADGWASRSRHQWTTIGLPNQNWKWRMRFASIELAREIENRARSDDSWDIVLCTDMMNVAELKALAKPIAHLPIVVYFHENQFAYPSRGKHQTDHHFLFTNFVSALSADSIWFNSAFNQNTTIDGIKQLISSHSDDHASKEVACIVAKSHICPPPISVGQIELSSLHRQRRDRIESDRPLHLVWAARWEYDKNPDDLLKCLQLLAEQKVPFRISVLGEAPDGVPHAFETIKDTFGLFVESWGYQKSRRDYWNVLESADVFLSTANHEFFGLSVAEAISVGIWPLLPNRLSYPELLDVANDPDRTKEFTYQNTAKQLASRIRHLHRNRQWNFSAIESLTRSVRDRFSFEVCVPEMDRRLDQIVDSFSS